MVTPGTALDETWLTEDNNFLAALVLNEETAGLAYVISSPENSEPVNYRAPVYVQA